MMLHLPAKLAAQHVLFMAHQHAALGRLAKGISELILSVIIAAAVGKGWGRARVL
jgi:hypothetical protein